MVTNHDDAVFDHHPTTTRGFTETVNWALKHADFGTKLLVERLKFGVFQQDGSHFLMEARPFFFLCRNDTVGEVFLDELFAAGALFIASIQPEIDGKAYRATEVMAGHRIVGQRIC